MNPNKPFYPQTHLGSGWAGISEPQNGISIRDYIAIEAMKAILFNNSSEKLFNQVGLDDGKKALSNLAYQFADALIAESNRNNMEKQTYKKRTCQTLYSFEDFLKDRHAEFYHGTDDDITDSFEAWLSEIQLDDLIAYADQFGTMILKKK